MSNNTVRVQILVATDRNGKWQAYGWAGASPEDVKEAMGPCLEDFESGEIYHWVEADVPLPAEVHPVIEGKVIADTGKVALRALAQRLGLVEFVP